MKKLSNFIVEKRNIILILFIFLTGLSFFSTRYVNINSDIVKYLPNDSETRIGKDIMDVSFKKEKSSYLNVMFKGLSSSEKIDVLNSLTNINGVSSVDYNDTDSYNKDEYTLYVVNVDDYADSSLSREVYTTIQNEYNVSAMSGSIYEENKPILEIWIVILAISMAMVILILMSESFVEPFLYLFSIGIAVFINKGTNIIFSSVSEITDSITAILQLALSVDYSIMLSNRYRQEREIEKDKIKAMKNALYHSFKAISSSSLTTIMGLIALVFMSFTIGKDLGFVLAKGVLLSLICIFFCLPSLLLLFDKLINKTKKKSLKFNLNKLGSFSYKTRYIQLFIIISAFILSYSLKGNLDILYTGSEQDEVSKVFDVNNQMAIVYKNEYDDIVSNYCKSIEKNKNIDSVLCYGNTLNEKLAYNELNKKINDLGQDTKIDEYLIKLVYYNYYNKNNVLMTFNEFISFIKDNVYTNENITSSLDFNLLEKLNLLENFTDKDLINKYRNSEDLANILGIDSNSINNLMILYNSKHTSSKMTLNEFTYFMYSDILNNNSYYSNIDNKTKVALEKLKVFSDKNIINKKMNQSEISKLFGLDKNLTEQLFLFYHTTVDNSVQLTLKEFADFILDYALSNDNYSSLFDEDTIFILNMLSKFSDVDLINKELNSDEMLSLLSSFGINSDLVNQIYLYYAVSNEVNIKLSVNEFASFALTLADSDNYNSYFTNDIRTNLGIIKTYSDTDIISNKLDSNNMANLFDMNTGFVQAVYNSYFTSIGNNDYSTWILDPYNFISIIINNESISSMLTSEQIDNLNMIYVIMNSSKDNLTYSYNELSNILNMTDEESFIKMIYGIYNYSNNEVKISVKNLIDFILIHKNDEQIQNSVNPYLNSLVLAKNIIDNSNTKFDYNDLSTFISIDLDITKNIYSLYDYTFNTTLLTPYEFSYLILNNKDNPLFKDKLNNNSLEQLRLVLNVMNSGLNEKEFGSLSLSKMLGIDNGALSLVYSLYDFKNDHNNEISLIDFTDFVLNNVINDNKYKDQFSDDDIDNLNTIYTIMSSSLKDYEYDSYSLYKTLSKLSSDLSFNLVDIIYIYYGSVNEYNSNWKMTVEEFINYLHDVILNDDKFNKFTYSNMNSEVNSAYNNIKSAKELLVSKDYSRVVINTNYHSEDEEVFEFIQSTLDEFKGNDGIYVVGDSPMALEMSKNFNNELDFITILTMLFIFIVVAFTFKSLVIPLILVLIIQCAVYITMDYLSITGGNVYFISLLIVQAILMGATIDYAIVYTSYYKESRLTMNVKDSIINAYNNSIHTILTSSSILIIVTLIVANFASAIAAKICETISQGAFCSALLILLILPGVLASFDKIICRKN